MYKISTALIPDKMSDERKDEIIESIKSYRAMDDPVLYVLALLPGERFTSDTRKLHCGFYKLKKEYPDFFEDILFDTNGLFPYSEDIEQVFFRFGVSGVLGRLPPFYNAYEFTEKTKKAVLEHFSDKFSEQEKEILKEMGKKLENMLFN